jgi:tetratricopeptide (TPR) repeat protein
MMLLLCFLLLAQDYTHSAGYTAYRHADALFAAKKIPEAVQSLEQALKQDDKLVPALTLYAKIAMTMNRFELARDSLVRALAVDPKAAYAQFLYGLNFYLTNDLVNALPQFRKARQLDPRDARAALYLGMTYESLGQTKEAMMQYEDSVRLNPVADSYLTGARLLYLESRLDECDRWIQKALQLDPASRDAHFEKARLLLRQDHSADAAKEGERALALSGGAVTDIQLHYLLIRAYRPINPAQADRHADTVRALEAQRLR